MKGTPRATLWLSTTGPLYIAGEDCCQHPTVEDGLRVVHACKHPCYVEALQRLVGGPVEKDDPRYLSLANPEGTELWLNMIDPPTPLFKLEMFYAFLDFVEVRGVGNLLIHCNKGLSRAPSLALLAWARQADRRSYRNAKKWFVSNLMSYTPGLGIDKFLEDHWGELMEYRVHGGTK